MKKYLLLFFLLLLCVRLAGCRSEEPQDAPTFVPDVEPTATYDWMAGESPVPNKRIGLKRYGVHNSYHAISPDGIYFMQGPSENDTDLGSYIWYVDHDSNAPVKLCGRPDCTHNTPDCNAYVYKGTLLSFYGGYLYSVCGNQSPEECKLIRMDPDGRNRVTVLDLLTFAKENGGDLVKFDLITEGYLLFTLGVYEREVSGTSEMLKVKDLEMYKYKLNGAEEPQVDHITGTSYNCGNILMAISNEARNGGEYGSLWSVDLETDTAIYLTDHPGVVGYYGEEQGFYFKDGAICCLTYATQQEEIMVETGLEGKYILKVFPDCMVLVPHGIAHTDSSLYIYNWNFQLVETIEIEYPYSAGMANLLFAETANRLILADESGSVPKYYINKSELGTGNVKVHAFVYA